MGGAVGMAGCLGSESDGGSGRREEPTAGRMCTRLRVCRVQVFCPFLWDVLRLANPDCFSAVP
jgi:hypothetical protein